MSTTVVQRNIELARKGYAAFDSADIEAVMALITDDCVWHAGSIGPLAGDYTGKDAILDFFMKFGQLTEGSYKADIHDVLGNDEHTVALGTSKITRGGKTREDRFIDVIHPDDQGRVKEFWRFVEDQSGLAAFLGS